MACRPASPADKPCRSDRAAKRVGDSSKAREVRQNLLANCRRSDCCDEDECAPQGIQTWTRGMLPCDRLLVSYRLAIRFLRARVPFCPCAPDVPRNSGID